MKFDVVMKRVPEGYVAWVEEVPGANAQGSTREEAYENLKEEMRQVFEAQRQQQAVPWHEGEN